VSALAPPWGLLLTNHSIWKHFIPTASRKTFEIGGYYSVEVVPGELAVISLNTLYFFESNTGKDLRSTAGC
jgi:endopolyphosphatase